jgi:IclR family KDG regulon transcriptional repressor
LNHTLIRGVNPANQETDGCSGGIQVLEVFAHIKRPASVNEIHQALSAPQSSMSKLLKVLASRGYLEHDRKTRTYFPTLKATTLGSWLQEQSSANRTLMDIAMDLQQRFGHSGRSGTSVVLGVQNDTYVMYLLELPVINRPRPSVSVGMLRPLCAAGVGKALMMLKSDDEIALLIRRINSETPETHGRIDIQAFLEEMRISRHRGYAVSYGGVHPDSGSVAVPLPLIPHQPRMALGVGAQLSVLEENLHAFVAALSEKLTFLTRCMSA